MKRVSCTVRIGALCLTAAAAALLVVPAAHAQFGVNLIANSDAEAGPGGTGGAVASIPGWTASTPAPTVVLYGSGAYPSLTDPGPVDRGTKFFGGGNSASTSLSQTIDLGFGSTAIDAGEATFDLSGYLGGFSSQNDQVSFTLTFLDSGSQAIGSSTVLGPVLAADRANATGMLFRQFAGAVPVGARSATTVLQFTRSSGTSNDGYADNVSLVVSAAPALVPEAGTVALTLPALGMVGAMILRRRRK